MTHFKKFLTTIIIGIASLVSEFVFDKPILAFSIIAITGGVLAFFMFIEMIKTLRSGKHGVDILAITAIIATVSSERILGESNDFDHANRWR